MEALVYFLLVAGVFYLMMRAGCGAHVSGHRPHLEASAGFPERAVDPVCGRTVSTAASKSSLAGGRAHFFCSGICRETFEAAPERFPGKASGAGKERKARDAG